MFFPENKYSAFCDWYVLRSTAKYRKLRYTLIMRVISNKALVDFSMAHPLAHAPMQAWRKIIESRPFMNFADIKSAFNATDKVGDNYIFDIGGNKYRIVTGISFQYQKLYIRYVFTHEEYNKWKP